MQQATFCWKLYARHSMLCPLSLNPVGVLQETDKATIDVEAPDDGVLGKILVRVVCPFGLIFRAYTRSE